MKIWVFMMTFFLGFQTFAQPNQISLQGVLKDSNGNKLNGNFIMSFNFYTSLTSTTPIYGFTPAQKVEVSNGVFNVVIDLGTQEIFKQYSELWVGIKVENEPEFPKIKIVSTGYALRAKYADGLTQKITQNSVSNFFEDGSITQNLIANGAVGTEKIKDGAVVFSKIADNGCAENQIMKYKKDASGNLKWQCSDDEGGSASVNGTENHIVKVSQSSTLVDSVIVDNNGMVGIGTETPEERLHVVGNIKATGKICDFNGCIGGSGTGVGVIRFNDDFSASVVDPNKWTKNTGFENHISIENGRLKMIVPQTSNQWYGPALISKATLQGDFDVMVDTDSTTVTSGDDWIQTQIRVKITGINGTSYSFTMGDLKKATPQFYAWTNFSDCTNSYVKYSTQNYSPKTSYRIMRVGTTILSFYKNQNTGNQWKLYSQCNSNNISEISGDAAVQIQAYCGPNGNSSDQVTYFDNFKIEKGIDPAIVDETINVTGAGEVGIGTSSPAVKLDVNGGIKVGMSLKACNQEIEGTLRYDPVKGTLEICNGSTWLVILGGKDGKTKERAALSCKAILDDGLSTGSGVYWLDPDGDGDTSNAFQAYCDMETDGGGWTMCYTEKNNMVHISTQTSYTGTYGVPGYRTDCRNIPFKEVLYVNHDTGQKAWFTRQNQTPVKISDLGYSVAGNVLGLWTPHGVASTSYNYQLNICDAGWMWVGLMMTGYTNCWKQCNNWCGDTSSPYFRTDGDDGGSYNGVAFNENGHKNVSYKTMSVGIR